MKKLFRLSTVLAVSGAVAAGAFLFWTAQSVQKAEDELYAIRQAAQSEAKTIRVLKAEWSYLNRPDRLEVLAREYMGLGDVDSARVMESPDQLPEVVVPVLPPEKPQASPVSYQQDGGRP